MSVYVGSGVLGIIETLLSSSERTPASKFAQRFLLASGALRRKFLKVLQELMDRNTNLPRVQDSLHY